MAISIRNLRKSFGTLTAVDIPELNIPQGGLLGLVGNNGAGKTTLLRLMLDLLCPDEGEVQLNGVDPKKSEGWKQWTGAFLDDRFLIDYLTPEEYFEFIAKVDNVSREDLQTLLNRVDGFTNNEIIGQNKYIRNFSAGNKQKIGIIAALIGKPDIVILDEPFNFLDPTGQEYLKKLLTDYQKENDATIIVSSHNLQHVVDISTRILLMEAGHIIKDIDSVTPSSIEDLNSYFAI